MERYRFWKQNREPWFATSEEEMIEDLEHGDVAETIGKFYE